MSGVIIFLTIYLVVPLILASFVVGSFAVAFLIEEIRTFSSIAGWFAGLLIFLLYMLYVPASLPPFDGSLQESLEFTIGALLVATVIGFVLSFLTMLLDEVPQQLISTLIMLFCSIGLIGFHMFYGVRTYNNIFGSAIFGMLFGILFYIVLFRTEKV